MRRRLLGVAVVLVAVAGGLAVHFGAGEGAASDIAGDALYVVAVWGGLVALFPRWSSWLVGAIVLVWCVVVELFQLTGLPVRWAGEWPPIVLVFGTVFDARDLLVYAVTALVIAGTDAAVRRPRRRRLSD
ncbi:DUF2809 domain-containing protein [Microbacterium oleivorans]|uniref:ribosomal maturation YjgA family protein n=1 Tax=Microbacterium oleivorans TaxID=273677 RepID=UPI0010A396F6|nr:DUF2809 domain-containing protein [Microbacterium oleivorans]THE08817.1 DUF2809 domain-containing protein [Microbacterium oleivorans]